MSTVRTRTCDHCGAIGDIGPGGNQPDPVLGGRQACPQCAALATRYPAPGRQPGTESRNRTGGHSDTHSESNPAESRSRDSRNTP